MADNSNSMEDTVSTVVNVLEEFINVLREEMPDINVVYDEALTYETALKKYRADNEAKGEVDKAFPLFAFKRSVLKTAGQKGGIGRRMRISPAKYVSPTGDSVFTYTPLQGEFNIDFALITDKMDTLERFEVAYLSHEGISRQSEITVKLPEKLGEWKYYLNYEEELSDKAIQIDDNFYKVVSGTISVRGIFLVLRGTGSIIKNIKARIHSYTFDPKKDAKLLMEMSVSK